MLHSRWFSEKMGPRVDIVIVVWQRAPAMPETPQESDGTEGEKRTPEQFLGAGEWPDHRPWLIQQVLQGGPQLLDALHFMSATCSEAGTFARAEFFAREGVDAAREQQNPRMLLRFHIKLGEAMLRQGKFAEGMTELHTAYTMADGIPLNATDARIAASALAKAYRTMGQTEEAANWQRRALLIAQSPRSD